MTPGLCEEIQCHTRHFNSSHNLQASKLDTRPKGGQSGGAVKMTPGLSEDIQCRTRHYN